MQHDYNIANDSGANVRADLNNVLAAIKTMNSGATAPSATSAGMSWFDTSDANTWYWKLRNNSDDGWINVGALDVATDVFQPMIDDDLLTTLLDTKADISYVDTGLATKVTKVSSTDNAVPRFNGTTGEVQNSGVFIDDSGNIAASSVNTSSTYGTINKFQRSSTNTTGTIAQLGFANSTGNFLSGFEALGDGDNNGSHIVIRTSSGGGSANLSVLSERVRFLSTGGITFNGDTSTANALDDYEEGTWTPILDVESGTNPTYTVVNATYIKVGDLVWCQARLSVTANGAGLMRVSFPFSPQATHINGNGRFNIGGVFKHFALAPYNQGRSIFTKDGSSSYYTNSSELTSSDLYFSMTYRSI